MTLAASLKIAHLRALNALDDVNQFKQIAQISELVRETTEMENVLRQRVRSILDELRRNGATTPEIARRSGLSQRQIRYVLYPESQKKDADGQG